jgi:hypothetical protein
MTDQEAEYWDEYFTQNPPEPDPDPSKVGVTARSSFRLIALDSFTEKYLFGKALALRKTPADIVHDMIRREMASV